MTRSRPYILTALLIDILESEGWQFGTGQHLRLQDLLRQLPPDTDDDALGLALAPILARNAREQELVYEKLKECSKKADELVEVTPEPLAPKMAEVERELRKWYWRIWIPLGLLGMLAIVIALFTLWQKGPATVHLKQEWGLKPGQSLQLCPSGLPKSDSLPARLSQLIIDYSRSPGANAHLTEGVLGKREGPTNPDSGRMTGSSTLGRFSVINDTCLYYTAKDSVGTDSLVLGLSYSDDKQAELQLKVFISSTEVTEEEKPDSSQVATQSLFTEVEFPHPHNILELAIEEPSAWVVLLAKHWPWLRFALFGLLLLAFWAAWKYWLLKRKKLIAELSSRTKPPYVWNIHIPGRDDIVLGQDFANVLQVLRRRTGSDSQWLDVKATIAATAERGGMPEFKFRHITRPVDYLLLIDRQSQHNHRAQLYDALYRAFREQEIEIARFFYDSDIRLCYNEAHPQGLRITEIAQRYGDARLIVFGTGTQLISPLSGKLESWTGVFNAWDERALFTPKPYDEWGRNEHRLSACFDSVLPASLQSLAFWIEETEAKEDARFELWRDKVLDAPAAFWQPDPEVPLPMLQMQYDPLMVKWIAACAIYPALYYDLTVWLGHRVFDQAPKNDRALSLEDLAAVFRLRWFVDGQIPRTARLALLEWLEAEDPDFLLDTRLALADVLRQNRPPEDSAAYNDHALSIALTELMATKDPKRRKALEMEIGKLLEAGAEADFVSLKYLDKPKGLLDFVVPDRWKKYLHPGGKPALGNRLPLLLALLAGLCLLALAGNSRVENWLEKLLNPCKGQTVEYRPKPGTPYGFPKDIKRDLNKDYMLCLDSPEDTVLWVERLTLDLIQLGAFQDVDSLNKTFSDLEGADFYDSLKILQETRQNVLTAFWNKGVAFYEQNKKDSACLCFEQVNNIWGAFRAKDAPNNILDAADLDAANSWCAAPSDHLTPTIQSLEPKRFSVLDADTDAPIQNALVRAQGMPADALSKQGGQFVLNPPTDWRSPRVRLFVTAGGYEDGVFNALLDGATSFQELRLKKVRSKILRVNGVVRSSQGIADAGRPPVPDVEVSSPDGIAPVLTDVTGKFTLIFEIPANTQNDFVFELNYKKTGYDPYKQELRGSWSSETLEAGTVILQVEKIPVIETPDETTVSTTEPSGVISNPPLAFSFPEMIPVPGGTFMMGSNKKDKDAESDEVLHKVTLSSYEIGKYEVTIGQYLAFCDETKTHYPEWLEPGNDYNIETGSNDYYKTIGMSRANKDYPVTGVSWDDAVAYCEWLSRKSNGKKFRLPTEAEWEYAARGGQAGIKDGYTYSGSNNIGDVAWYVDNSTGTTHPVGKKDQNHLKLHDMSGNVWEWCSDWYGEYDPKVEVNPTGAPSGSYRVLRGGSRSSDPQVCRASNRSDLTPDYRYDFIGFRLARTP